MEKRIKKENPCGGLFLPQSTPIYDNLPFSRFFEENDKEVIRWAENVLEKLEGRGILPTFLKKKENEDFRAFWGTITHIFALIVLYARQYKKIDTNQILFEMFIQNRGLVTNMVDSQEQMKYLFYNYLEEYSKRGRLDIISKEGEILGELLRLIRYNSLDEFIFALLRPEATGWAMGHSSPTCDRTNTVMNVSKAYEYTKGVEDLNNYPLLIPESISIMQDENGDNGEIFNAMTFFGNQAVGIDGRVDLDKLIIIDPNLSYEISLQVKVSATDNENLKFGVAGYETVDGEPLSMGILENGQITGSSLWFHENEYLDIKNDGMYYYIKGILLSTNEKFLNAPTLNFPSGRALSIMPGMKYIAPIFIQERTVGNHPYVYIYDFHVKPLYLPFSQGYLGERDIIAAYYKNNAYQRQFTVETFLKNYLVGYKNIFGSELIRPYVGEEEYQILFKVFSNRNKYIPNARITINREELVTDVNGEAKITLPRGQWYYEVEAENFENVENSLLVDKDAVEYVQLMGAAYERVVTFFVRDKETKDWMQNVKVSFAGKVQYTGSNGIVTFEVFPGIYEYVAEYEDYYTVRRNAEIVDSTNIEIEMEKIPYYNVTFRIRDGVEPVSGASVLVTGEDIPNQTGSSNAQGLATGFIYPAGTYHYKVVKEGYITVEKDFTIYGNAVIDIQFNPIPKYNINFVVRSNGLPVAKADVTFNGTTLQTERNGVVTFVEVAGSYAWKVSKTEFNGQEGTVEVVDKDVTVEVDLVQIGYLIDFYVTDDNNTPLDDALVTVGTESISTSGGQAQFVRISGGYNWTVQKEGYYTKQGVVTVNGENKRVDVQLKLVTYDIIFTVRMSGQPVKNQPVVLGVGEDEQTVNTDASGNAVFNRVPGSYPWNVTKTGYEPRTGTAVLINQPLAITVDLVKQTGKLTVTVLDVETNNPISNAVVTINGETRYSNNNGIAASWTLELGVWEWSASHQDYNPAKGNVNITAGDNAYTIKMAEKASVPFNVTFQATIGSAQASGATIEIVGQSEKLTTNELGLVSTQLFSGTYDYVAKYPYCYDVVNSFTVYNSDTRVPINFTVKRVNVRIQVVNGSNIGISGAQVTFNGMTQYSDGQGYTTFNVEAGSSGTATASKLPQYNENSTFVSVGEYDTNATIVLGVNTYKVIFDVVDEKGISIRGVRIVCGGTVKNTDGAGRAVFGTYVPPQTLSWQASKAGYQSQNGSVSISNSDEYVNVVMTRNKCQVTYNVRTKSGSPISGVTVEDNISSGVTSSNGTVSWMVPCNDTYAWVATSQNYFTESGSYTVGPEEFSKTIDIIMEDGAVLEVRVSNGTNIALPVLNTSSTGLNNLRVKWGDGDQTLGTSSHTYSSGGTKIILFDFNGMSANLSWSADGFSSFQNCLTKVIKWFTEDVRTSWGKGAFQDCSSLESVVSWTTSLMSGSADSFFYGCSSLRSVPAGLFDFITSGTFVSTYRDSGLSGSVNLSSVLAGNLINDYSSCFYGCKNISSVSGQLRTSSNGTSLNYMFAGCSSMSSISNDIGATNIKTCIYMFSDCSNLQSPCRITFRYVSGETINAYGFCNASGVSSLPSNMFSGTVGELFLGQAFYKCTNLSSISSGAFHYTTTGGTQCTEMFYGCTSLLNVSGVTIPDIRNASGMFRNSGLTTITSSLFSDSSQCSSYTYCFSGCRNLRTAGSQGNPITPPEHSVTVNINSMFENCSNLSTTEYAFGDVTVNKPGPTGTDNSYIESGVLKHMNSCTDAFSGCSNMTSQPRWECIVAGVKLPAAYMPLFFYFEKLFQPYQFGFPDVDSLPKSGCFRGCTRMYNYADFNRNYPEWF